MGYVLRTRELDRIGLIEGLDQDLTRTYEAVLAAGAGAARATDAGDADLRDRFVRSVACALADARILNEGILRLGGVPSPGVVALATAGDAAGSLAVLRALEASRAEQAEARAAAALAWGERELGRDLLELARRARERAAEGVGNERRAA
jgi:hypothetical protein